MRPRLVAVDLERQEMTLVFLAQHPDPARWITVPMKTTAQTKGAADLAAQSEVDALTDAELAALYNDAFDGAPPLPKALGNAAQFAAMVTKLEREKRYQGAVYCPGCGFLIGRASSPHLGYVTRCSACGGALAIKIDATGVLVSFTPP